MDSARSYHASKTSVRRFEITDYQAALTDVSTKEQKTPQEGDMAQNTGEQENSAENTTMTAKDWQSRFLVSSARWDMRSSASEQTLSTIREYTVRYIFDLLFPSRNSTLRDWMQENGWNAGNSVDNARTNSGSTQGTAAPASDTFYPVAARMKVLNYVGESWSIEQEDTSFSTVGTVRTKDGREINFNVNVNMSRRCEEYYREELNVDIQVDGGINDSTMETAMRAGANLLVAGSYVFNGDLESNVQRIQQNMQDISETLN